MRLSGHCLGCVALLTLVGCGYERDPIGESITLNAEALAAVSVFTPALEFTAAGSSAEYGPFINPVAVEPVDSSTVLILDQGAHRLYWMGHDGTLLRSAGGLGDGPSEFRNPRDLTVSGDSILVLDNRILVLNTDGERIGTVNSPDAVFASGISRTPAGIALQRYILGNSRTAQRYDTLAVVILTPEGVPSKRIGVATRVHALMDGGSIYPATGERHRVVLASTASGFIYSAPASHFRVEVYEGDRLLRAVEERDNDGVKPSRKDVEHEIAARVQAYRSVWAELPPAELQRNAARLGEDLAKLPVAHSRPAVTALLASEDRVLALRFDLSESPYDLDSPEPYRWLLFDHALLPRGWVLLPRRLTAHAFRGCRIYGVMNEADGSQSVAVYRLPPEACS